MRTIEEIKAEIVKAEKDAKYWRESYIDSGHDLEYRKYAKLNQAYFTNRALTLKWAIGEVDSMDQL